jgi:hypothetical protein
MFVIDDPRFFSESPMPDMVLEILPSESLNHVLTVVITLPRLEIAWLKLLYICIILDGISDNADIILLKFVERVDDIEERVELTVLIAPEMLEMIGLAQLEKVFKAVDMLFISGSITPVILSLIPVIIGLILDPSKSNALLMLPQSQLPN